MLSTIFSHFESIGDNCELGLLQRKFGIEYSNIFKWSFSFSIDAVIRALETRFHGIFQYSHLQPRGGGDMVNDTFTQIAFHSEMVSTFDGKNWVFKHTEKERHEIYLNEINKTQHLVSKTLNNIQGGNKILVYKSNEPATPEQEKRLWKAINSIGPSKLLIVSLTEDEHKVGQVVQLEKDFYRGFIDRFAPYNRADLFSEKSWSKILQSAVEMNPELVNRNTFLNTNGRASICELAELNLIKPIEEDDFNNFDIGDYIDRYQDINTHSHGNSFWALNHFVHHGYFEARIWRQQGETVNQYSAPLDKFDFLYRYGQTELLEPFLIANFEKLKTSIRVFIIVLSKLDSEFICKCYEAIRELPKFKVFEERYPNWLLGFYAKWPHKDFLPFIDRVIDTAAIKLLNLSTVQAAFRHHFKALPASKEELIRLSKPLRPSVPTPFLPLELLSLGMNCEVAKNIELWRQTEMTDERVDQFAAVALSGGHFFDWNISSLSSVLTCITHDFRGVFQRENIRVREEKTGTFNYVDDVGNGVRFHHIFSRENDLTTEAIVEREFPEKKKKVDYLIKKFLEGYQLDRTVFYLRRGNDSITELVLLCKAIKERREARPFFVVSIRSDDLTVSSGQDINLIFHHMPYSDIWSGVPELWNDLFLRLRCLSHTSDSNSGHTH